MSDLTNVTIDSTSVSFDTVSDVDSDFTDLVDHIFENLQGESKRSDYFLEQLRNEQEKTRKLTKENSLLISLYECFADYLFDQIEYNTDYNLLNEIIHLETQVKGLESDIRTYQNHRCPEAICPECDEIQVKVEDDTWQDTKPEMGTAVKDAVEAFKDDTVLLPITNNRIFS